MSDECLVKWKRRFSYYTRCQAVIRKFTLAGKALVALTNEQMHMVRYQTVGIICATGSTRQPIVIVLHSHPIEGRDELVIILSIFKDILMIDAPHHHVVNTSL